MLLIGKSTISMAIFNSYMFVYQRVTEWQPVKFAHHKWISLGQAPRCEVGKAEGGGGIRVTFGSLKRFKK